MQTFKDTKGREWHVEITVADVEALIDECGVDIGKSDDITRIFDDTTTFIKVLFTLLADQVEAAKLTPKEVKKSFGPDTFEAAGEALMDAIVLFIPARARRAAEKTLDAIRARQGELQSQMEAKLDEAIQQIQRGAMDADLMPQAKPEPTAPAPTEAPPAAETDREAEIREKAERLRKRIESGFSNTATGSPASSASTPAR